MRDKEKNSESKEKWTGTRIERGSPLLLTLVQHRISMERRRKREEGKEEKIEEKGRQHRVRLNEEQARKMKGSRGGRRGRQGKDLRRRRKNVEITMEPEEDTGQEDLLLFPHNRLHQHFSAR